jgi:N-acetylated-alpha-linked acidic dipeptidase
VYGLQVLRMAEADVLPYDYEAYGEEVGKYLGEAHKAAGERWGDQAPKFDSALAAARRFAQAGAALRNVVAHAPSRVRGGDVDVERLNQLLLGAERALLLPNGLPRRPWFRHAIYAPADLKGYSASPIPGVSEAIQRNDAATATQQLQALTGVLNRAAELLESYQPSAAAQPRGLAKPGE